MAGKSQEKKPPSVDVIIILKGNLKVTEFFAHWIYVAQDSGK